MKSTYVITTADSRLHADIMLIRLRRAGISIDRISAVFTRRFVPNSFFFWLRGPRKIPTHDKGESYFAAGPLRSMFTKGHDIEVVRNKLRHLGLDHHASDHFAEALYDGHPVLCVSAKDQDEAAVAWHIFHHSKAEMIAVSGSPSHASEVVGKDAAAVQPWIPAAA